jgi:hypothetical protein
VVFAYVNSFELEYMREFETPSEKNVGYDLAANQGWIDVGNKTSGKNLMLLSSLT